MSKPLKFYQTLNQAPRSAKHGKHRRSSPSAHGHSTDGADNGTGGSDQSGALVTLTVNPGWVSRASGFTFREPEPPAIPDAGIRAGEIIGHRLWWVIGDSLCSLAHRYLWPTDAPVYGDTASPVLSMWHFNPIWGGTYAFASAEQLAPEIERLRDYTEKSRRIPKSSFHWMIGWQPVFETDVLVSGTIKMWGDVIEHERGYRAEFAKVNSIDVIFGDCDIEILRRRYLPALTAPK